MSFGDILRAIFSPYGPSGEYIPDRAIMFGVLAGLGTVILLELSQVVDRTKIMDTMGDVPHKHKWGYVAMMAQNDSSV